MPQDELLETIDPVQDPQMDGATGASQPAFNRALQGVQGTQAWETTQACHGKCRKATRKCS